jgi:O-antigen ligase
MRTPAIARLISHANPREASQHRGFSGARGGTAVTMLTVYLVLLFAVPSNLRIASLGSLGKPAILWGLFLLLWWVLSRAQRRAFDARPVWQPVRGILIILVIVALVSFAAAMLRGQPADQVTPAMSSIVRLASWAGVVFVTLDGIRTHGDVDRLVRRLTIAGAALGAFGLVQFFAGGSLLEWTASIPGVDAELGGIDVRGGFTRASGTASHPLEYTAAIAAVLPLAIAVATTSTLSAVRRRSGLWWGAVLLILTAAVLSVSRSATIGLVVALASIIPFLPKILRRLVALGALAAAAVAVVAVPGLLTTTLGLFTGAGDDPSAQSRTDALARVPEFLATSPVFGQGLGTFLPRYYIFDNQWAHTLIELGVLGLACLLALGGAGVWGSLCAYRRSPYPDTKLAGAAAAAALLTISVLFLFFDGLSFGISAGLFFFLLGLSGAMRTVARADEEMFRPGGSRTNRRDAPVEDDGRRAQT